jgi:hypothetical protein
MPLLAPGHHLLTSFCHQHFRGSFNSIPFRLMPADGPQAALQIEQDTFTFRLERMSKTPRFMMMAGAYADTAQS